MDGRAVGRTWGRRVLGFLACAAAAAVVALPVVVERAVEGVRFHDELGTFPVTVGLSHDGRSTLDTGLFGKVFYDRTGPYGFGAYARSTGPPEAAGTLASYVDPAFVQTNVELIDDPSRVVRAYADQLSDGLRSRILRDELLVALVGGVVLRLIVPGRRVRDARTGRVVAVGVALVVAGTAVSAGTAKTLFDSWGRAGASGEVYTIPGVAKLGFSSPETREVAAQVQPFIDKNTTRIDADAAAYEKATKASLADQLDEQGDALAPREGEKIVLAEADPQGSFVGVAVRRAMDRQLVAALGRDAFAVRTISGDVSSNGTVAERAFIAAEAKVAPQIPTVATAGDHDSTRTWEQMRDNDIQLPDLDEVDVDGLRIAGANDREHKTLFGGSVSNTSGTSEQELGRQLREKLDDEAKIVLLHQPDAAAGYLGFDSLSPVRTVDGSLTEPYDDGIDDVPPGIVNIGHLHVKAGPWVLWNSDGSWTVVNQLGTSGGVENTPTFSRFSTPYSTPLKPLSVQLQYVRTDSGLETGYVEITCDLTGACTVADRVDVGLPGGEPATP